jgi:hypothetical protein
MVANLVSLASVLRNSFIPFAAIGASALATSLRGQSDAVFAHSITSGIGAGLSAAYHLYTESIKPFFSSSSTIDISTKFSGLGSGVLPLN